MRWRLDVAYDGTDFSGWAAQPGLRTVQGELELWIARVLRLGEPVSLTCAGRTDAGVHARGQVCHLDLPDELSPQSLLRRTDPGETLGSLLHRRLARALPADVVVRQVSLAPEGFDARFSAVWRRYVYRLSDADGPRDPLQRRDVVWWPERLDVERMNAAAEHLVGLRDFAAFCKRREGATTVRELQALHSARTPDGLIETTVRADAFCHSMVRSLMGALTAIACARRDLAWLDAALTRTDREPGNRVMPAHGLCLEEVGYPAAEDLAARAAETRHIRCLEGEC